MPARLEFLSFLNSGLGGFSQVGKFLTVYPQSTADALLLARKLHAVTKGLAAPVVPYDARYRANSVVYYRYGAFLNRAHDRSRSGRILDPEGKPHRDVRRQGGAVPPWLHNPFNNIERRSRLRRGPIGVDYLPYKALMQRGKGGVYEAIDLSATPACVVIIKEGRPHGETSLAGDDGRDRVHHEAAVLCSLIAAGLPVPRVLREFTQNGNRYVVLEKVEGRRLIARDRIQPLQLGWRSAKRVLNLLEPLLRRMHEAGWIWRDCKPAHIFTARGGVRVIDFEGACRLEDNHLFPWGTRSYTPPVYHRRFALRKSGTLEDDYALGVIAFQFLAGDFPPLDSRRRAAAYRQTGCPLVVAEQIERLLAL